MNPIQKKQLQAEFTALWNEKHTLLNEEAILMEPAWVREKVQAKAVKRILQIRKRIEAIDTQLLVIDATVMPATLRKPKRKW